jgi:hypothetical protein
MEEEDRREIHGDGVDARFRLEYVGRATRTALCGMVVSSSGQRVARLYWYEKVRADDEILWHSISRLVSSK